MFPNQHECYFLHTKQTNKKLYSFEGENKRSLRLLLLAHMDLQGLDLSSCLKEELNAFIEIADFVVLEIAPLHNR